MVERPFIISSSNPSATKLIASVQLKPVLNPPCQPLGRVTTASPGPCRRTVTLIPASISLFTEGLNRLLLIKSLQHGLNSADADLSSAAASCASSKGERRLGRRNPLTKAQFPEFVDVAVRYPVPDLLHSCPHVVYRREVELRVSLCAMYHTLHAAHYSPSVPFANGRT